MVKKPQKTAFFILLAAAWLALAVIWAGVFIIENYDHEHINSAGHRVPNGKNCQICLEIQIALRITEAFGRLGAIIAITGFIIYVLSFEKPSLVFCPPDPVELKVKINC